MLFQFIADNCIEGCYNPYYFIFSDISVSEWFTEEDEDIMEVVEDIGEEVHGDDNGLKLILTTQALIGQ